MWDCQPLTHSRFVLAFARTAAPLASTVRRRRSSACQRRLALLHLAFQHMFTFDIPIGVNGAGGGRVGRRSVNSGYRRAATCLHGISGYCAIFIRSGTDACG
ncbi:unnamed protein product [Chrysodeixis includens]|uniref:Uncharacterized protein n=1 Tax=Chrysodeixis includens TaxID=689277 RepID=A0A9N8L054_CHRIL|nr:unnamed protein product [Chrysodeixis includens]